MSRRLSLIAACLLVPGVIAASATSKPKPPPKPKPRLELLTETQESVLRRGAIKVGVQSKRGDAVRAEATFVVDGYPEDFVFKLGPERKRLRDGHAALRFPLSARKREVLDFAIKSCRRATLDVRAEVGRGGGTLDAGLKRPADCVGD